MKRSILYLIICMSALITAACSEQSELPSRHSIPETRDTLRRLVVVYMAADNNLSSFADDDVREMELAAGDIPDSCALVVYLDNDSDRGKPSVLLIDKARGKRTAWKHPSDPVSTDSATMQRVLADIIRRIPAREHALVLWSHSTGWTPSADGRRRTWGSEQSHEMPIPTLTRVLEKTGVHWQYIFYDCCFMQCVEVAYQMRHVTDWSLAAPIEIPGLGAPYDLIMPYLFQKENFARNIPAAYHDYYEKTSYGVILSAIRSDRLDELARATAAALDTVTHVNTLGVQCYGAYTANTSWVGEFRDMASLMNRNLCPADYATWWATLEQAIPHRFATNLWFSAYRTIDSRLTDPEHFAGASMYIPVEGRTGMNEHWHEYEWARRMPQSLLIN